MPKYKCHKEVWALEIKSVEQLPAAHQGALLHLEEPFAPVEVSQDWLDKHNPQAGGFLVHYKDGYVSYSPREPFLEGYTRVHADNTPHGRTTNLPFGNAIEALKAGHRVRRAGWNGKGMFLFLLPAGTVPKAAIHDPKLRAVIDAEIQGDTFEALGSIRMFTADKKILTGWLASQTDMLSEDWEILE